jgi:vitamin K-dependent gamma-carboxylase
VVAFLVASAAIPVSRRIPRPAWIARLFAPVDIASLVYFRILFGAIMAAEVWIYFHNRWIAMEFIQPRFHFTYYGFGWVHPWPGNGMYYHFAAMGVLAVCIIAGFAYRISAALFFLGFTYMFLLEQSLYLNHFYFVSLVSFLMIFVPAHRKFSVDALLRPRIASEFAPAWSLWILRAQMGFVYFFGGIAKLNSDWLQAWPLRIWMPRELNLPVLWRFRDQLWLAFAFSYSGLLLDLLAVPLLLWRRTRPYMFAALALFHLTNSNLFDIGIFPWFATAMTALYFEPDWPRRLIGLARRVLVRNSAPIPELPASEFPSSAPARFRTATLAGLAVYCTIQILLPLRHWLYPGNVAWTEQGHRFSWRMKLRNKEGTATFHVTDPETGRSWSRSPGHYLARWQYAEMDSRPDMLLQFAHFIADQETQPGHRRVEVRVDAEMSLNGRRRQPLIDPTVDLGSIPRLLRPAPWITQLTAPRRKSLLR